MFYDCPIKIAVGLHVALWIGLGPGTIVISVTLGLIIYRRKSFKRHHIFPLNIILADFILAVILDISYATWYIMHGDRKVIL